MALAGLAAALAPDFSVFAYDRRGRCDGADIPPYPVEREVENLDTLIDEASEAEVVFSRGSDAGHGWHAVPGFSGIPVACDAAALEWYQRLLRFPPTFFLNDIEVAWKLAKHRYVYIVQRPSMPATLT